MSLISKNFTIDVWAFFIGTKPVKSNFHCLVVTAEVEVSELCVSVAIAYKHVML